MCDEYDEKFNDRRRCNVHLSAALSLWYIVALGARDAVLHGTIAMFCLWSRRRGTSQADPPSG